MSMICTGYFCVCSVGEYLSLIKHYMENHQYHHFPTTKSISIRQIWIELSCTMYGIEHCRRHNYLISFNNYILLAQSVFLCKTYIGSGINEQLQTVFACKLLAYLTRKIRQTHQSVKVTRKSEQVAKRKPALGKIHYWQQLRGVYN